ncbi:hypothetical protein JHK82_028146 [Glycine max]|nr:hypothetical protein JHK85_028810 [Glycine max]KAG5127311.1 hypothetical protein JHK82_028146 [Glycine max]KAG5151925.1 hypothetical protein JHK84_028397 [Glycine max]
MGGYLLKVLTPRYQESTVAKKSSELQKSSKDLVHKVAQDDSMVRRSTRVWAPPRENPSKAFVKYANDTLRRSFGVPILNRIFLGKLEKGVVLNAICYGFQETTELVVCLSSGKYVETNECLTNNGGCWKDNLDEALLENEFR